ncbi:MAG: hypothetical protein ACJAT2_002718 [Bacteriovoracaceae bacterium]|jgi:hypothetical protein
MKWAITAAVVVLIGVGIYFSGLGSSNDDKSSETKASQKVEKSPFVEEKSVRDPFNKSDNEEDDKEEANPGSTSDNKPLSKLDGDKAPNTMALTEEEMEELEEYFEKIEEDWADQLKQLFKNELQLSNEIMEQYEDLREGFEEEKLAAFQEYHEQMVAKHGENYAYRPSEDEKIFEKKVLDEYYDRLRKLLGDEAYNRYKEVRERFNERIKSEQDPAKGILVIDF